MNCKPGDLAVIVKDELPEKDVGKLVYVRKFDEVDKYGATCWLCDSASGPLRYWEGKQFRYSKTGISIPDAWLRPIRDPGDDATDEMVRVVGKPEGVTA